MALGTGSELLKGVIDLHTHGYPEILRGFGEGLDDAPMAEAARSRGMGGYVLKSHIWPTMDRAHHIGQRVEGIEVTGSITLNSVVGGVCPGVVEAAIAQGAGAIWFPTWSSANDLSRNGFSRRIRELLPGMRSFLAEGLSVLDSTGVLTQDARAVLAVAKDHGILVSTGHLSPAEVLALAAEAERIGFAQLVFTHPDSNSVGATREQILEAAKRGVYIEWTFNGLSPASQRIKAQEVVEWIETLGPSRCVLTTDTFGEAPLLEPDMFQFYLGTLHALGLSAESLKQMTVKNPGLLLGTGSKGVVREKGGHGL